jgi:hypothetical protein
MPLTEFFGSEYVQGTNFSAAVAALHVARAINRDLPQAGSFPLQ